MNTFFLYVCVYNLLYWSYGSSWLFCDDSRYGNPWSHTSNKIEVGVHLRRKTSLYHAGSVDYRYYAAAQTVDTVDSGGLTQDTLSAVQCESAKKSVKI